jgi:hypothetical protein
MTVPFEENLHAVKIKEIGSEDALGASRAKSAVSSLRVQFGLLVAFFIRPCCSRIRVKWTRERIVGYGWSQAVQVSRVLLGERSSIHIIPVIIARGGRERVVWLAIQIVGYARSQAVRVSSVDNFRKCQAYISSPSSSLLAIEPSLDSAGQTVIPRATAICSALLSVLQLYQRMCCGVGEEEERVKVRSLSK